MLTGNEKKQLSVSKNAKWQPANKFYTMRIPRDADVGKTLNFAIHLGTWTILEWPASGYFYPVLFRPVGRSTSSPPLRHYSRPRFLFL